MHVPALLKVFVSLALILLVNRLVKQLLLAVASGAVLLALWVGHSPGEALHIAWNQLSETNNLLFLGAIFLVIWLSHQMAETGVMKDLVVLLRKRLTKRMSMAILPALIGFLPMPGGALFSAPLVDDCDGEKAVNPLLKTQVNYWFRHIWEYWWPLYPGVLLAVEFTGLEIWQFILLQFPLCLVSVLSGYLFLLRKIEKEQEAGNREKVFKRLLALMLPILIIVACYILFKFFIPVVDRLNKYLPICLGVLLAIIILQLQRPLPFSAWRKIILSRKILLLVLLIAVVQMYGAFIAARLPGGGYLSTLMKNELNAIGLPLWLTIVMLPFICGIVTGIAVGMVGASFPIVLSLCGPDPAPGLLLGTTLLAFGSGYVGMLLSPVHICLIVTNDYFKTKLEHSILKLAKPALGVLGGTFLFSWLVRLLLS